MNMFWKLLEQSTLISGVIALGLIGTACYCVVTGTELPGYFIAALGTIVGYFFSEKAAKTQARLIRPS